MISEDSRPELCYICAAPIESVDERDMDHVPPRNLFNKGDRENLRTLPTHKKCNGGFSKDDEYFRLCLTTAAYPEEKARGVWHGPVLRSFNRPQSQGFKASVLDHLVPAEVQTDAGIYLGTGDAMLQKADRIMRVVNRVVRGLYTLRTRAVLPADWPVSSDLMNPTTLRPVADLLQIRFFDIGNGTFRYDTKHLRDDLREAFFWLVFYRSVHFWGYTGTRIRERLPWGDERPPGTRGESALIPP